MKKFRKPTQEVVKDEQVKQDNGEVESIPVFKERGKPRVSDKGKAGNTSKHG